MKKFFLSILILSVCLSSGCLGNRKTALEKFKEKNPVDGMIFSEKRKSKATKINKKNSSNKKQPISSLDLSGIKNIPDQPTNRLIKVSGENVPLRKGPGSQYGSLGIAKKDQTFSLLRTQKNIHDKQTWYLAEDENKNKFFISSLSSSLIEFNPKSAYKEKNNKQISEIEVTKKTLQNRQPFSLNKIKTVINQEPTLPEELTKAKHITLNFEGTELYDVITTFSELLKIDYIVEGNVQGKVTLQTFNKIQVEDLYSVLEQILALHNVTVTKSGNFYRFLGVEEAAKKPLSIHYGNDSSIPEKERLIIQIIPLKHISVESMKKIITPLLSPNASFIEIPETNNLMMIEMANNVRRIINVVEALDIDKLATSDIQLYKLNNSESDKVVLEMNEIFSSMGYAEEIGESLTFLSLGRLNSILVVNAFDRILPTIEFWVNKLDQPVSEGDVSTFVYYVQNGEAGKMSALLSTLFQSQESSQSKLKQFDNLVKNETSKENKTSKAKNSKTQSKTNDPKSKQIKLTGGIKDNIEGEVTILPDEDTNALIIRTSPRNYPAILEVIKKLDLLPQQVLIEVLIIDLKVDEATRKGVEWILEGESLGNIDLPKVGSLATSATTNSILGTSLSGATASLVPGGSLLLENASRLKAKLELFASDSQADVLANPILVTSDNKAASISVTDEIPVASSTLTTNSASPVTSTSIEFKKVGVKLDIFPKINSDNFVNMKIRQEISSKGADVTSGGITTASFNTREVNTEVVLKDNQVLVMGGLMRTDSSQTVEGVPGLMDLPYIGKLFSSESTTNTKTELMIFITPHIISTVEDSSIATREIRKRLSSIKSHNPRS
ncbi:MAG: type II secretion system secretin GspD [Nitrospina sp.]|jgi:general secretion pathway protein D|nr:type II secretion system secretin GspD [Nitrospina sp.]